MGIVAVIDIGSNSLKLVVGAGDAESFEILHEDRERLRLGRDVERTGEIGPEAVAGTVEAVRRFKEIAERFEAEEILAVATAAMRRASNSASILAEIETATGIRVEVISPLEEARLIGVSAHAFFRHEADSVLNIDVGGGSTEISLFDKGLSRRLFSMPVGAVTLTEKCITSDPPSKENLESLVREIFSALREPLEGLAEETWQISSATSGTSMHLVTLLNFGVAETPMIEIDRLSALSRMLTRLTLEQRAGLPGISQQRAEVLIAGAYILEGVMTSLGIEVLKPCGYSLREGVAIDYLRRRGIGE